MRIIIDLIRNFMIYLVIFYLLLMSLQELYSGHIIIGLITMIIALVIQPNINKYFESKNLLISKFSVKFVLVVFAIIISYFAEKNVNYLGIIVTISSSFFIYLMYIIIKSNYDIKDRIEANKIKEILVKNNLYEYIVKFVNKAANVKAISNSEVVIDYIDKEQIEKLQKLLYVKNIHLNYEEIKTIVNYEINIQEYQKFKSRLLRKNPINAKDYAQTFVDIYGFELKHRNKLLDFLFKLLKENNVDFSKNKLIKYIEDYSSNRETKLFEDNLLKNNFKRTIDVGHLDHMNGYQFESFLKNLFEKMGYTIIRTNLSHDQGADLIAIKLGTKYIIQAKRYSEKVTNKAVQEVAAALKHYKADKGIVVTNNIFTTSAKELAKSNSIELIDRNKLKKIILDYL